MLNFVKSYFLFYSRVLLLVCGAFLASCGGSGGGSGSASSTVSGTAATGAAIEGSVSVYGSNGGDVLDVPIDNSGQYKADVTGLTAPFLLLAIPSDSNLARQYSFAAGPGTANITPMTSLVMAIANGNQNPATLITTWPGNQADVAMKLPAAQSMVNANFSGVFAAINSSLNTDFSTFDIFSSGFTIGDTYDQILDIFSADVSNGPPVVTINGQAFALDSMVGAGGAGSGTGAEGGGGATGTPATLVITGDGAAQLPAASLNFASSSITVDSNARTWVDATGTSVTIAFFPDSQNQIIAITIASNENVWVVVDVSGSGIPNVSFDGNTVTFVGIILKSGSAQDLVISGTLSN